MSDRIIKGKQASPSEKPGNGSRPARRIIPANYVKIERHRPALPENRGAQAVVDNPRAKGGPADYMPLSSKLDLSGGSISPMAINQLVEERVKQFEARFQHEKEEAFAEGLSQGETRGYQKGLKKVEEFDKLFETLASEFNGRRDDLYRQMEAALRKLALDIAEAVIGEAAANSSETIVEQNLRRCLAAMKGSGRVTIRINPVDYDFAKENTEIFKSGRDKFDFVFEPDPTIAPGGCFLETSSGAVDGRLESQFEILKDTFLQI